MLTNREVLALEELPKKLVVIGGGVIGVEFASFFSNVGVEVEVVEMMKEIFSRAGVDSVSVRTGEDYVKPLMRLFKKR